MPHHRPFPRPPDPPDSANGWGRYVASTLEHLLVRLHYLEVDHDDLRDSHEKVREHTSRCSSASSAPTTSPPAKVDWGEVAKQGSTATRWIAFCIVISGLALKKIEIGDLQKLGKWFANGG